MKVRTLIAGLTVLAGCTATTFAGERRVADVRDRQDFNRQEVVVRHDDRNDARDVRDVRADVDRHDRDFGRVDSHWDDRVFHFDVDRNCR